MTQAKQGGEGWGGCVGIIAGAAVAAALLAVIFGWIFCWVTIPKGNVGVLSWFGQVEDQVLDPGPHVVNPLKSVYRMTVQTQKDEEPATVPTRNGLPVEMNATLLYHLDPAKAPNMAREVGSTDYAGRVVTPYFKNAVRDTAAEFAPEAFYTAERTRVEAQVTARLAKELEHRGVVVEAVMLLDPKLPAVVQAKVQDKVAAEQDVARMQFVLQQKRLEAEAKVVEAEGIAKAQAIVKKDLDHNYLVYLWIEALKESAKHNNATIYIPTGGDGMPLFRSVEGKK